MKKLKLKKKALFIIILLPLLLLLFTSIYFYFTSPVDKKDDTIKQIIDANNKMLSTSGFEDDYFSFQQRYKIAIYLTKLEHMIGKDAFVILLDQKLE